MSRPQPEAVIQNQILLALSRQGHFVWRNATGKAKNLHQYQAAMQAMRKAVASGSFSAVRSAMELLERVPLVSFGLIGSADILGTTKCGLPLAVEVKTATGRQSEEQKNFQAAWQSRGGIYVVARSVDDALAAIPHQ